jgi:mRNA interferase MazF
MRKDAHRLRFSSTRLRLILPINWKIIYFSRPRRKLLANGTTPRIPSMIVCDPGDIFLVPFPFSDASHSKKRPSLILSTGEIGKSYSLITVAMISSQLDGARLVGDVLLADWAEANLLHPSLLRLSKVATLDRSLLLSKLGRISKRDLTAAKKEFKKVYSHWI